VKRPILVILAAAILNIGVVGTAPARAAGSHPTTASATPAHDDDGHGGHYHRVDHDDDHHRHRHHGRHHDGDGDDHDGRHRQCAGLVVICLL
jgi:hypothetical protein